MTNSILQKLLVLCCLIDFFGSSARASDFLIDKNAAEIVTQPETLAKLNVRLKEVGTVLKAEAIIGGKTLPVTVAPSSSRSTVIYFLLDVSVKNQEFLPASRRIVQQMADRLLPASDYEIGLGTVGSHFVNLTNSSPDRGGRDQVLKPVGNLPDRTAEIYRCTLDAMAQLKKSSAAEHKVIILFTSGRSDDKDAANSPDGVIAEANRQGISVFTVGFAHAPEDVPQWGGIRRVAKETGGAFIETTTDKQHIPQNGDPGLELLGMLRSAAQLTIPLNDVPAGPQNLTLKLTVQNSAAPLTGSVPIEVPTAAGTVTATPTQPLNATPTPAVEHAATPAPTTPAPTPTSSPDQSHKDGAVEARPAWLWPAIVAGVIVLLGLLILIVKSIRGPRPLNPNANGPSLGGWEDEDSGPVPPISFDDDKGETEPGTQLAHGWLEEIDKGGTAITRHPINKSKINIGRSADSDLRFDKGSVSVHHATIHRRSDGNFVITDLRASNGVYVNRKRVEHIVLKDGDTIEIGEVRLRFVRNESTNAK